MSEIRKVNFTLPNGATFNAEGSEEHINRLLEQFTALLQTSPIAQPARKVIPSGVAGGDGAGVDAGSRLPLDRLFSQDDHYGVALMAKPKTDNPEADGLLGILYGFAVLRKETNVTAIRLQRAAEKSGLDTPRLGRTLAKHAAFVTETGKGKGKRYGLNNPGMAKAVEILTEILG